MTDAQLAVFMGLDPTKPEHMAAVANLKPQKRAVYESMAKLASQLNLWTEGLAPKPTVMVKMARRRYRRRTWRDAR